MAPDATESRPAAPRNAPAWGRADLAGSPHDRRDKADRVRSMFAAIAPSYDLNNRLHSLGLDQAWRRRVVRTAGIRPGDRVLDAACGTGDLTHQLARADAEEVIGLDFTREMLDLAERKRAGLPERVAGRVRYVQGDAERLAFEDGSFDVVTIAFGVRNLQDPARGIAEMARVLRPGGRLVILEFDRPRLAPIRCVNALYAGWVMPRTATLLSRDRSGAYRYLPRSIDTFMSRERVVGEMERAGLGRIRVSSLSLGICACYRGIRV